jgi:hypothetical protein
VIFDSKCISVAAVTADYGFALTASPFFKRQKGTKRLRPGVRRLAEAPRTLATVPIRGHRLRSASRRPPLDVCGFAARRYAPNPLMDTYARPAEGAKDQKQIKIKIKIKSHVHSHIAGRLLQPCTGLTNHLPQLDWAHQEDIVGCQAAIAAMRRPDKPAPTVNRGIPPALHHSTGCALARQQLLILIHGRHRKAEWRDSSGGVGAQRPFDEVEHIERRCSEANRRRCPPDGSRSEGTPSPSEWAERRSKRFFAYFF